MYASAEIIVAEAEGVALPLSAITTDKHGTTTRLVAGDVVKQVKIETGIQDGAFIEVKSGLKDGDVVRIEIDGLGAIENPCAPEPDRA